MRFKFPAVALSYFVVFSCGVLEPAPNAVPEVEVAPVVAPRITTSGKLVTASESSAAEAAADAIEPDIADASVLTQPQSLETPVSTSLVVTTLFHTDRCNALSRGGFIWFTDEVVLNDWLSPLDDEQAGQVTSKIDFSTQGALLLDFGIAGGKGAGALIVDDEIEIKDQTAFVRVKQFKAPANKKGVQVVTHPCSLFLLPREGFTRLVVLSDMDDELTSFDNN